MPQGTEMPAEKIAPLNLPRASAPLNNFFDFTYPEAAAGPPPGQQSTSHIPSGRIRDGCTPDRVPGPLLIFRNILNYGKTKKSTHGHTTATPIRPHPWILAQGGNRRRRMQPANSPARQATRWPAARSVQGRSVRLQGRLRSTYPGPPDLLPGLPCAARPARPRPRRCGRPPRWRRTALGPLGTREIRGDERVGFRSMTFRLDLCCCLAMLVDVG